MFISLNLDHFSLLVNLEIKNKYGEKIEMIMTKKRINNLNLLI